MIPILILAAGRSSRMRGRDKLLEDVGGEPLLERQVRRALELGGGVYVAIAPNHSERRRLLDPYDAQIITVPEAREGQAGTLRGAVRQLPKEGPFMVVLADLVDLEAADLKAIYEASVVEPQWLIWRGATCDGKPGHPIVFDGSLRPLFDDLSGDTGGESIVRPRGKQTRLVPLPDDRARRDLDTPEDWEAWRRTRR